MRKGDTGGRAAGSGQTAASGGLGDRETGRKSNGREMTNVKPTTDNSKWSRPIARHARDRDFSLDGVSPAVHITSPTYGN
jgi:hypothetical protein